MVILLTLVHVLVCFFLVIVVLLQSGKAADLAGAFGGMGSQTAFGPRGAATVLSKATTVAAALFMITSLTLAIFSTRGGGEGGSSVLDSSAPAEQTAPATPGTPATPSGEQPTVTLTDPETGESETIPLPIGEGNQGQSQTQQAPENEQ